MSRRTRRRRPRREPVPARVADTPINEERLRQIYANMKGRSITLGLQTLGITVEASTPQELAAKTEAVIVELMKRQRPS